MTQFKTAKAYDIHGDDWVYIFSYGRRSCVCRFGPGPGDDVPSDLSRMPPHTPKAVARIKRRARKYLMSPNYPGRP